MLTGTGSLEALAAHAPSVEIDPTLSLKLGQGEWLQFTYELPGDRQSLLPPGLHPTTPLILTLQLWRLRGGELGDFGLAQARLSCRAGMRIRSFALQCVIDGTQAVETLSRRYGYIATPGTVDIYRRADRIEGRVETARGVCLDAALINPQALEPSALQHIGNMNLGRVNGSLQMLQVEPGIVTLGLQRGPQQMLAFDAPFWGLPGRQLGAEVIGAFADVEISLPPVRFVQDPSRIAVLGTTKVESAAA
jgi:hypothetical protein